MRQMTLAMWLWLWLWLWPRHLYTVNAASTGPSVMMAFWMVASDEGNAVVRPSNEYLSDL